MDTKKLGVCYYPEHWSEDMWSDDAQEMVSFGISHVRIGEFAWSRIEPEPNKYEFDWLDRAIEVLTKAGLKVILCTPTATPPRWMADIHPDMFAIDQQGQSKGFGSRRHYCFSHVGYRSHSRRITEILAKRYGDHKGIIAWQTDNEYGCHDTVLSYSSAAEAEFKNWLRAKYGSIEKLNDAWGNVFWSMEYRSFEEIGLPNFSVTETNPSHRLDFRRFSSDQVISFNDEQVSLIRKYSPNRDIVHNFMGRSTDFDHFAMGSDLDVSSWDSYPLGFLFRIGVGKEELASQFRMGDPDFQAFHHELYRATGNGRAWIMEQQPGPVNWAPQNAIPMDGMIRLWTWEAFAHGMELVSYFRWRQVRFAQEQMHAGLKRPDNSLAQGGVEICSIAKELRDIGEFEPLEAPVGLVFDYESQWMGEIQPQGIGYDYFKLVFESFQAFRRNGIDVELMPSTMCDLDRFKVIVAPGLHRLPDSFRKALSKFDGTVLFGPRTGDKDDNFQITNPLPPAIDNLPDLRVIQVETLPDNVEIVVGNHGSLTKWREFVEGPQKVVWTSSDGYPVLLNDENYFYLAGWPDNSLWDALIVQLSENANLQHIKLPGNIRKRCTTAGTFVWNYGSGQVDLKKIGFDGPVRLDGNVLTAAGVALFP